MEDDLIDEATHMYKSGENDKEEDPPLVNPELEVESPAPELLE